MTLRLILIILFALTACSRASSLTLQWANDQDSASDYHDAKHTDGVDTLFAQQVSFLT